MWAALLRKANCHEHRHFIFLDFLAVHRLRQWGLWVQRRGRQRHGRHPGAGALGHHQRCGPVPARAAPGQEELREIAYAELLRQRAVSTGLLAPHDGPLAPVLDEAARQVLEAMVDAEVSSPEPQESECQRYHQAHQSQFTVGQALHVRHILFAVTPGINVQAPAIMVAKVLSSLERAISPFSLESFLRFSVGSSVLS